MLSMTTFRNWKQIWSIKSHVITMWPNSAKFHYLATLYSNIFSHFHLNKQFQNKVCWTQSSIKKYLKVAVLDFNFSFDILATVLATIPNIGQFFKNFMVGHSACQAN
jgi:hypothetical protein